MKKLFVYVAILLFLSSCSEEGSLFKNPSPEQTGISFENTLTESDDLNILDYLYFYNGGGVAIGDINNDSLPDIFFSGNQVKNRLYLNKGNLKFEDITEEAGVAGNSTWNTGAVMGDVNGDGLLDIYVCAVVGINGFTGYNELYINNGTSKDSGTVSFTESAAKYGLDFDSFSSNAAFLDYDRDGDLDMYLLNHAVHTQESFGNANLRYKRNYQTGDKLLRNDGEKFTDVSEAAGIFGGVNGYGLGLAVSDFNQDGWPDIYVGNDFHEDDYYYLNNGPSTPRPAFGPTSSKQTGSAQIGSALTDSAKTGSEQTGLAQTNSDQATSEQPGSSQFNPHQSNPENVTFTESTKRYFGHTSRFSMGNDVADIDHDGWPDLISLDMLPQDETVLKSSQGDNNVQTQKTAHRKIRIRPPIHP